MKEPSEKDIKKRKRAEAENGGTDEVSTLNAVYGELTRQEPKAELDKIADINAKCVAAYEIVRSNVFKGIETADIEKMNKYVTAEYGKVYTGLKGMILDSLNEAGERNIKLIEKLLDEPLPAPKLYEVFPKTSAFKYTNKIFTEKSVSVRSQKAADEITKIIADGRNDGLAIKDIQKKIDTVMGFRDAQGRLTDKAKELIKSGRFSHKNGHIYQTYRIARTEVMRMNAFSTYEQFLETKKQYPNARLKLIAHIDTRTREQSKEMNKQISNADGEFLYPDGKYYRLGTAPAQWCINDRETQTIIFLSDKEEKENENARFSENSNTNNDELNGNIIKANNITDFETQNYNLNYETGAIFNNSNKLIKDFSGSKHHIEFSKDDIKLLQNNVFTHNHPSDLTFSEDDIFTGFLLGDAKEIRAVTKSGKLYSLQSVNNNLDLKKKFYQEYDKIDKRLENNKVQYYINQVKLGKMTKEYYEKNKYKLWNDYVYYKDSCKINWLKENAQNYGFVFNIEELQR